MGLKRTRNAIVLEALEINYIRCAVVTLPHHTARKSHSLSRLLGRRSPRVEMPRDSTVVEIMANKKGNGRNTRYQDVLMREDPRVDRCLVSKNVAKTLLGDGEPELIDPQTVSLSDGKTYQCVAKFDGRWCDKSNPGSAGVTLYVTEGIKDGAVFPKSQRPHHHANNGSTLAPIQGRPRTSDEKRKDAERDNKAKKTAMVTVKENRDQKKEAFIAAAKKPGGASIEK